MLPHRDVLRRYLEWRGLRVKQVMNITDVEDKIIRKATGVTYEALYVSKGKKSEVEYLEDGKLKPEAK